MQSLHSILEGVRKGYLTLVDLTEAYLHVLIHPDYRQFLHFLYVGKHHQYQALPFGLSSARRVFTKLMTTLVGHLWTLPVCIQFYLDDILIQSSSESRARQDLDTTIQVLQSHGFSVNHSKSHLIPTMRLLHLEAIIDTVESRIYLSPNRQSSLKDLAVRAQLDHASSLLLLCQLLGKMVSCFGITPWARLHSRALSGFSFHSNELGAAHLQYEWRFH